MCAASGLFSLQRPVYAHAALPDPSWAPLDEFQADLRYLRRGRETGNLSLAERLAQKLQGPLSVEEEDSLPPRSNAHPPVKFRQIQRSYLNSGRIRDQQQHQSPSSLPPQFNAHPPIHFRRTQRPVHNAGQMLDQQQLRRNYKPGLDRQQEYQGGQKGNLEARLQEVRQRRDFQASSKGNVRSWDHNKNEHPGGFNQQRSGIQKNYNQKRRSNSAPGRPADPERVAQQFLQRMEDAKLEDRTKDIDFDVIENGGEEPEPPMFKNPTPVSPDLADIFGQMPQSFTQQITIAAPARVSAAYNTGIDNQWLKEELGGDYSRYAPSREIYSKPTPNLPPATQAELTLSHQKQIGLDQRVLVSQIIGSTVRA